VHCETTTLEPLADQRSPLASFPHHAALLCLVLFQLRLEDRRLLARVLVEPPRREEVPRPKDHLDAVERLGQEVGGTLREHSLPRGWRRVRGDHDDRQERVVGPRGLEVGHQLQAVPMRHVEIQEHEIRRELDERSEHPARVREHPRVPRTCCSQHALENHDIGLVIIDDEDLRIREEILRQITAMTGRVQHLRHRGSGGRARCLDDSGRHPEERQRAQELRLTRLCCIDCSRITMPHT